MGRIARRIILFEPKIVHKTIHSHHKDMNFEQPEDKDEYLFLLNKYHSNTHSLIHAFCGMDNHFHELYAVFNQPEFSNFMRDHLSQYAKYFNKKHDRRGRVTNERPFTKPVGDDQHEMISVFYIHANALDIVNNIDDFEWSTHHLYAYGMVSLHTKNVTLPQWYIDLGASPKDRQNHYRILFQEYLHRRNLKKITEG